VDGSHIRTLLLTFFYRHMPEILRRGHLYIAQPPLFKIARGKKEMYLKDQETLDTQLLLFGTEKTLLEVGSQTFEGAQLLALCKQVLRYQKSLEKVDKRRDSRVVDALLQATSLGIEALSSPTLPEEFAAMHTYLQTYAPAALPWEVKVEPDVEHQRVRWVVVSRFQGAPRETVLDGEFFESPEFLELKSQRDALVGLGSGPFRITHKGGADRPVEVARLVDVIETLLTEARRGLSIQRYKGLGEMNPEQLWDTTMNPDNRTLLAVRVDDIVAADDIFTVLMGDQVEPRREFIERYALDVRNLDI
jgi:DNA gyrase subunit B